MGASGIAFDKIIDAKRPEDIFGTLDDEQALDTLSEIWRTLSRQVHPDLNDGDPRATEAALRLNVFYEAARKALLNGNYGTTVVDSVVIQTRRNAYKVTDVLTQGASCVLYRATYTADSVAQDAIMKVARSQKDNDLVANEARTLKTLLSDTASFDVFSPYITPYIEAFGFRGRGERKARQGVAMSAIPNVFTLEQVRQRFPNGVHAKDAAWMFRRLLFALGYVHEAGLVHGAILPEHVLIEPSQHGVILIDWKYSVESGKRITAIPAGRGKAVAPEILAKKPATPATDLFMAARVMGYVMGGDLETGVMPDHQPKQIRAFMRGTAIANDRRRPDDARALKAEYDELIVRLWGPRRFRPFSM